MTTDASVTAHLKSQRYGKDRVRLVKVLRHADGTQDLAELTVTVLLEGDFESVYTQADNRAVVATDSVKNTIYALAKLQPTVLPIERFGLTLGRHFLGTYPHVSHVHVTIQQHPWHRMTLDGAPHPHSFTRGNGTMRRTTQVTAQRTGPHTAYAPTGGSRVHNTSLEWTATVESGFCELAVLKTTGSAFTDFLRDGYTTLPETDDRILSTNVDCRWRFTGTEPAALGRVNYDRVYRTMQDHTLRIFAHDNSASVQATLFRMAHAGLRDCPDLKEISYALPNNHIFAVNLAPLGLANTGRDLDVYVPVTDPSGLITATVARTAAKL
ncbi:hypothetical protein IWQ60_012325 [Tieghemiomyces parasiticus]|uniref:Uricase n=1 Tax=Tieghemiomyces parasiticus TaxID=78921 RepID=A0A9W7ZFH4_9FUNG|nr:hypothetical protein IWQ60_012325 [Tieghemiomyces parasiticus]